MKRVTKNTPTDRAVEKTFAQMRQLLTHKGVREFSLQTSTQGTRFTITVNMKVYSFWLPIKHAFSREIQEMLARAVAKREHHETP